jgi:hypothetical protein
VARVGERKSSSRDLVGKPERKKPLERRRRRWNDNINMDDKSVWRLWTVLMCLRIGDRVRERNFGLHKTRGIFWPAEKLLASREGICSLELVNYLVIPLTSNDPYMGRTAPLTS